MFHPTKLGAAIDRRPVLKRARSPTLPPTPYARCHRVNNRVPRERVRLDFVLSGRRARSASALQSFRRKTERASGAATEPGAFQGDAVPGRSEESSKLRVNAGLEGTRFRRRRPGRRLLRRGTPSN